MPRVEAGANADAKQKWEVLSDDIKSFQIALELIEIELSVVDPVFWEENNALGKHGSSLARIGLFLIKQDRIKSLRDEGRMKSPEEISQKAQSMVNLNRPELIEAFKNYTMSLRDVKPTRSST